MASTTFLIFAPLAAACIPLLDVIATWCFLRHSRSMPTWGGVLSRMHAALSVGGRSRQAPGENACFDESGQPSLPPVAKVSVASVPGAEEMQSRMKDLAIGFNGRQYTYAGYRHDRLDDAVRHAELIRSRSAR